MSAASFISMAGLISFMGYDGAIYLMGWTGGYVLLALAVLVAGWFGINPPDYVAAVGGPEGWWLGSPEGIGTVGMLLNFVVTLTVTRFTPPPPERVRALVEEIRLPSAERAA
jgi:Na+(H+)/acetate symporter ActP